MRATCSSAALAAIFLAGIVSIRVHAGNLLKPEETQEGNKPGVSIRVRAGNLLKLCIPPRPRPVPVSIRVRAGNLLKLNINAGPGCFGFQSAFVRATCSSRLVIDGPEPCESFNPRSYGQPAQARHHRRAAP